MAKETAGRVGGKVALITGAASGIGEATAKRLAEEGAAVAVVDIDVENGKRVAGEIADAGGEARFIRTDITKPSQIKRMVERTVGAFGRLDILHNNAIAYGNGKATELEEAVWDRTMDTGLRAVFLACKYGIPAMLETGGGAIVNTGSVHSLSGFPENTAYDTAKAGILGLTRVLAIDYGPDIRVNAVLPGAILTPLWKIQKVPKKYHKIYADIVPAKRLGTPEDIANAVLFLASDEASFITGTTLTVDGGLLSRCT